MAETVNLAAALAKKPLFSSFSVWLVGDTPIITHAWSEKAKREMLQKQVKAPKAGKDARDPQAESNKKEASQKPGKFMTYPHVNLDSRRYKLMPSRVFS